MLVEPEQDVGTENHVVVRPEDVISSPFQAGFYDALSGHPYEGKEHLLTGGEFKPRAYKVWSDLRESRGVVRVQFRKLRQVGICVLSEPPGPLLKPSQVRHEFVEVDGTVRIRPGVPGEAQ